MRHFANRFEVAVRSNRKTCLENIHAELGKRARHHELAIEIHARAGRLLAVS